VHDAVVELLAAGEIDAAIPRIAERAGVNPTSVYRSRRPRGLDRRRRTRDARTARPDPPAGARRNMAPGREPVKYLKARGDDLQATLDNAAVLVERLLTALPADPAPNAGRGG
jgi:hypothetical protein